ncbi:MAG: hypothetical protein J5856_03445 [Lachnospiraceae bacterium]|nr:hypothetical protein [Lachnospiraceae bacterium]
MKKIFSFIILLIGSVLVISCGKKEVGTADNGFEVLFNKVCSADEAYEEAKNNGVVLMDTQGSVSGRETLEQFVEKTENKEKALMLLADYYEIDKSNMSEELYESEKDNYPSLYFTLVEYDGDNYKVKTRLSSSSDIESVETFKYLRHFTGEGPETALFDTYEYYVLTDDPNVTWDEITRGWYSSQSDAGYRCRILFHQYYGWKE